MFCSLVCFCVELTGCLAQAYEDSPLEERVARLAARDPDCIETDNLVLTLVNLPDDDPRVVANQGSFPPMQTTSPASNRHALFSVVDGKVMVIRVSTVSS